MAKDDGKFFDGTEVGEKREGANRPRPTIVKMKLSKNKIPKGRFNSALQMIQGVQIWHKEHGHQNALDPKMLMPKQRRVAISELWRRGMRTGEIAEFLSVTVSCVSKEKRVIMREMGKVIRDFSPQGFLGWLLEEADFHIAVAKKDKDYRLSWQVAMDLSRALVQFGVLRPVTTGLQTSADAQASAEELDKVFDNLSEEQFAKVQGAIADALRTGTDDGAIDITPQT